MKDILIMTTYEQLKAISDRFRAEMLTKFGDNPITGQQLAKKMGIPRSKIHYHLGELEKNKIIEVVYCEQKNGIVQKFYQLTAKAYIVQDSLLSFYEEKDIKINKKHFVFKGSEASFNKFLEELDDLLGKYSETDGEAKAFPVTIQWSTN